MVVKTPSLFGHDKLLRARIWHAVNDKQRRRPLRSIRRGLPEQHHFVVYSRSSTGDGGNPSEAVLGIWTCNVPVQDNQGSVVQACNVPVREHQSSGSRRESEPTVSRVVSPPPFGAKLEEGALTAPEGAGGAKPFLRDERCDLSVDSGELRPANRARGRGVITGPSRRVGSPSCPAGNDAARCTWVSVREDEAGPEGPVGVFGNGARVGGHKRPTREGSFPLALTEKREEVANLIDYFFTGKRIERSLMSRGNTGSSPARNLGVLVLAFPHLKPNATSWSGRSVFLVSLPTPQTDRHHMFRERRG